MNAESAPQGALETGPDEENDHRQEYQRGPSWRLTDADRERGLRNIAALRALSAARRAGGATLTGIDTPKPTGVSS